MKRFLLALLIIGMFTANASAFDFGFFGNRASFNRGFRQGQRSSFRQQVFVQPYRQQFVQQRVFVQPFYSQQFVQPIYRQRFISPVPSFQLQINGGGCQSFFGY